MLITFNKSDYFHSKNAKKLLTHLQWKWCLGYDSNETILKQSIRDQGALDELCKTLNWYNFFLFQSAILRPWCHMNLWDLQLHHSNIHVKWADILDFFHTDLLVPILQIKGATGFSIRPVSKWDMTNSQPASRVKRHQAKHVLQQW